MQIAEAPERFSFSSSFSVLTALPKYGAPDGGTLLTIYGAEFGATATVSVMIGQPGTCLVTLTATTHCLRFRIGRIRTGAMGFTNGFACRCDELLGSVPRLSAEA